MDHVANQHQVQAADNVSEHLDSDRQHDVNGISKGLDYQEFFRDKIRKFRVFFQRWLATSNNETKVSAIREKCAGDGITKTTVKLTMPDYWIREIEKISDERGMTPAQVVEHAFALEQWFHEKTTKEKDSIIGVRDRRGFRELILKRVSLAPN